MENHIRSYDICLHFKQKPQKVELNQTETSHPTELVYIDYFPIKSGKLNKDVNILVVTDHFTRHAQAFSPHSKQLKLLLKHWGEIFCVLWFPRIHHFRPGTQF